MALTGKAVEALLKNLPKAAPMAKKEIKKFEKFIDKQTKVQKKAQKTEVKANARGLKAAQGKSLASPIKKAAARKNANERVMVKRMAEANKGLNMKEPYATKDAMRLADRIRETKSKSKK
jgi:hypothetical protein